MWRSIYYRWLPIRRWLAIRSRLSWCVRWTVVVVVYRDVLDFGCVNHVAVSMIWVVVPCILTSASRNYDSNQAQNQAAAKYQAHRADNCSVVHGSSVVAVAIIAIPVIVPNMHRWSYIYCWCNIYATTIWGRPGHICGFVRRDCPISGGCSVATSIWSPQF